MIIEVKETVYMGFLLQHVEKKGWQIVLNNDTKILFPTFQDAKCAVNTFYNDAVPQFKGKRIK